MSGDSGDVVRSVTDADRSGDETRATAGRDGRADGVNSAVAGHDGNENRAVAERCDGRSDHSGDRVVRSVADDDRSGDSRGVTPAYDAARRTPRKHRRVVFHGTELFDADGVKLEPGDMTTDAQRDADDDQRILTELPPHWGVFNDKR